MSTTNKTPDKVDQPFTNETPDKVDQPFTNAEVTINRDFLEDINIKHLEQLLNKHSELGLKFSSSNSESKPLTFKVTGSWIQMDTFYSELQSVKEEKRDFEETLVIMKDVTEDQKNVITQMINGDKWGGDESESGSLKKMKTNIPIACWLMITYFDEIYKNKGKSTLQIKNIEVSGDCRLSIKGTDVDKLYKYFNDIHTKETLIKVGLTFDLEDILHVNVLRLLLDEICQKITPELIVVHGSSFHVVVDKVKEENCVDMFKNIHITEYQNRLSSRIQDILLSACNATAEIAINGTQCANHTTLEGMTTHNNPSGHINNLVADKRPGNLEGMTTQSVLSKSYTSSTSEQTNPNSIMSEKHITTFTKAENTLSDMKRGSDIATKTSAPHELNRDDSESGISNGGHDSSMVRKMYGDNIVLEYIYSIHSNDLQELEDKYQVSIDDSQIEDGVLSIITNGEPNSELLSAAEDAIRNKIQSYHFDLVRNDFDTSSVQEKYFEMKQEIHTEAKRKKVRAKMDKYKQILHCTGPKEELSSFVCTVRGMLFPRRTRVLVSESNCSNNPSYSEDGTFQEFRRSLTGKEGATAKSKPPKPPPVDLIHPVSGVEIHACVTDITRLNVSAIVNAANEMLAHGGGVALAIAKAGGYMFAEDCKNHIEARGRLDVSGNCVTRAGNMPAGKVIHAVGPRWDSYRQQECFAYLRTTYQKILNTAITYEFSSLAIPAISSGIFGMPKYFAAEIMVDELVSYLTEKGPCRIKHIHLVDIDYEMISLIQTQLLQLKEKEILTAAHDPFNDESLANSAETSDPKFKKRNRILVKSDTDVDIDDQKTANEKDGAENNSDDDCCICMCPITNPKTLKCKHTFCTECIDRGLKVKPVCPMCGDILGVITGNQPPGTMKIETSKWPSLSGYPGCGTITIFYDIHNGRQTEEHPNPGKKYQGCTRRGYLPDNEEGRKVANLLKQAFDAKLIFTVGRSVTTGQDNMVTWNDIHHKTNRNGGAQGYGYPDPDYLQRVQEELAAKGIK